MTRALQFSNQHGGQGCAQANVQTAQLCGASRTNVRWNDPIAWVAKKLWPNNTPAHFAAYLGCSLRTAEYILSPTAKRKTMRADFVRRMFTGKHGKEFLKAWMTDSDAEWWQRMVNLEQEQAETAKQLEAIKKALGKD